MSVASPVFFTKEHIASHALAASPALAEQAIHCLELVAELSWADLSYQFKGGNSLLVVLQSPKRFSIDVDIATNESREALEAVLDKIVQTCGVFYKWTHRQHKTKPWLPLASYYLFYKSQYVNDKDAFVMLDAQLKRSPYMVKRIPIVCGELFHTVVKAEVPLPAGIVGDKLLTLGPQTLGIPIGKGKEAQRLKHVFDVSRLLEEMPLLDDIRESFRACIEHENGLQEKAITEKQILDDTLLFCKPVITASAAPTVATEDNPYFAESVKGLPGFASHLFEKGYSWSNLRYDMAGVALCIAAVCIRTVSNKEFAAALAARPEGPAAAWNRVSTWVQGAILP